MIGDWKPYPGDRKILKKEGYFVIVPSSYDFKNKTMPIFCEVCKCRFANKDDESAFDKFGCCSPCADQWAYSNKENWDNGWRPSKEQIDKFVEKRIFSNPNIRFE